MASRYGKHRGMEGYDSFRTGLTFRDVYQMLVSPSDDRSDWRQKSRRTVLGKWHEIKMQLWELAQGG
jgi:hypothetical protein